MRQSSRAAGGNCGPLVRGAARAELLARFAIGPILINSRVVRPVMAGCAGLRPVAAIVLCGLAFASGLWAQADTAARPAAVSATPKSSGGQLPVLGDGSELSAGAERRLGDKIAREIYRDPDYIDDPVLLEYVNTIWQALLAAARARGELSPELDQHFAWQVMLGRDRTVNAFALPGGYLGLHLGLISVVTSRDELASVLAHELSHVTQRHISRLISKQGEQAPWMIGAMILGALAASKNPEAANALIVGGQAVAIQNQLNFSRDMERAADRVGFGVMTQAGFAAQGFVSMFDKLQQAGRLNDNAAFPYLRSHPLTTERIADIQARQPIGALPVANVDMALEHAIISARARVLSNPGVDTLRQWVAEAGSVAPGPLPPARAVAALYAGALAAARLRDFSSAQAMLARLSASTEADADAARLTRLLAVEVALLSGTPAPELAKRGRPELLLTAQTLLGRGRAAEAAPGLQAWVALHPRDAAAWQLLASASAAQGQPLRAVRAEAEAQVAQLDYAAAMDRFRAAQSMVRNASGAAAVDHFEASIIDTRARQVQLLLREQALER